MSYVNTTCLDTIQGSTCRSAMRSLESEISQLVTARSCIRTLQLLLRWLILVIKMSTSSNHICVYYNCHKSNKVEKGIRFFKFPIKDSIRAEEWKKNCGNIKIALQDVSALRNKLICERHFLPAGILKNSKRYRGILKLNTINLL